ncbi:MAG: E3 ubiquitin protein ligase [archaeon]|nr:E3 ubiquitin protein ligase [archaeon]
MEGEEYNGEINTGEDYDLFNYDGEESAKEDLIFSDEYELLKADDFNQKRLNQIKEFVEFSSLSEDEAEIILINYNWNMEKLTSEWYENMESIKEKCGITLSSEAHEKLREFENTDSCLVCYEEFSEETPKVSLKCGHSLCESCYYDYIVNIIKNDPLLLVSTGCPQHGCNLRVTHSVFEKVLAKDPSSLKKYKNFFMKNFTDSNSDMKACPNPNCEIVVRVPGHGMKEIKCTCGTVFCFKCLKESHRPVDCEMAQIWEELQTGTETNNLWISTNTKDCPNCHKHIEKNQGCNINIILLFILGNHMTCRREVGGCGYEFCWICLGEWAKHGTSWYKCNFKKESDIKLEELQRQQDIRFLERLSAYDEKFMDHQRGERYAKDLIKVIKERKEQFMEKKQIGFSELAFLDEAIAVIIESRRMLKYSYVLGYYLKQTKEIELYEHQQYRLDQLTDQLHESLEQNEIPNLLAIDNYEEFTKKFEEFRSKVINIKSTIIKYKDNLLKDFEGKMDNLINTDLLYGKNK